MREGGVEMEKVKERMEQEYVPVSVTTAAMLLLACYLSLGIFMLYKVTELFI